jgi:dipeptidyl aminopeptidase/acylaminoacyl peptidase
MLFNYFVLILISIGLPSYLQAVTLKDFATKDSYRDVQISPDGKHVGVIYDKEGKSRLYFFELPSMKMVGNHGLGKNNPGWFFWVNNERVVATVLWKSFRYEQRLFSGDLYAVNFDGSKGQYIFGNAAINNRRDNSGRLVRKGEPSSTIYRNASASVINVLEEEERKILIRYIKWSNTETGHYPKAMTLDVYTGRLRKVKGAPKQRSWLTSNKKGKVQLAHSVDINRNQNLFRVEPQSGKWEAVDNISMGKRFEIIGMAENDNSFYAYNDFESDTLGIYRYELNDGNTKLIYRNDRVDVTKVVKSTDEQSLLAFKIDDGYPAYGIVDSNNDEAKIFEKLVKTFEGNTVSITSKTKDGEKFLVRVSNDTNPGTYYLYDNKAVSLLPLFSVRETINSKELSYSEPLTFQASDGKMVSGYITYPKGMKDKTAPLVVLPHGGPRARDYWAFDPEVQMLASKGYAVLQVNFRGSIGYGLKFRDAGNRHWGDRIQEDIFEASQWVIKQGKVNKNKICIMGASFGAYSALQSATLYPEHYKCVIANAGIYNLELLYEKGDIKRRYTGTKYLNEIVGDDVAELKRFSPVTHIEKLKSPVFIVHGEKDDRAPLAHAEELRDALIEHNKSFKWLIKNKESHGFYSDENRLEYYEAVIDFLDENLK